VPHNTANAPNAVSHGGGIYAGSVTLTNSTVAFNRADSFRPGISIGGGIYAGGVVSLTDSTLTGNYASLSGGAVYAGSVTVANSIIVGNAAEGSYDISGAVTESNGHNLFGSAVSGSLPGDLQNVTAQSTETVALLDSSTNPALGRGEGIASIGTDQRGEPRPSAGGHPDIGAFELEQSHAIVPGSPGVKLLAGTGEHEALFGLAHGEVLRGGRGNDLLDGGKGADWLRGGPGGDALIGGSGPDRFIFAEASHSAPAAPDRILD
jgi:predicted outer membrane repeat protein